MNIADKILRMKGNLITNCDKRCVKINYYPFVTNEYVFKDGSFITISLKHHHVGF